MNGGLSAVTIVRTTQGLAIDGNQRAIGALDGGLHPSQKGVLKLLWLDTGDDPGDGVVNQQSFSKQTIALKSYKMSLAKNLDIFPAFCPTDDSTDGQKQHIEKGILNFCRLARVFEVGEDLNKGSMVVQGETPVKGSIRSQPALLVNHTPLAQEMFAISPWEIHLLVCW